MAPILKKYVRWWGRGQNVEFIQKAKSTLRILTYGSLVEEENLRVELDILSLKEFVAIKDK